MKCTDRKNAGKIQNYLESTKTHSPTGNSEASSLPPIGVDLMYIETSANKYGNIVFCSFERTDLIQISDKIFIILCFQQGVVKLWVVLVFNSFR